jgi:hypothetical protein
MSVGLDEIALWHPQLCRAVEGGATQEQFVGLGLKVAGAQAVAKDRFLAKEGCLD